VRGQRHAPAAPYPRERSGTHCTGGWVGLRAGLDRCGKSRPTGIQSPDRPARRQSHTILYILVICRDHARLTLPITQYNLFLFPSNPCVVTGRIMTSWIFAVGNQLGFT